MKIEVYNDWDHMNKAEAEGENQAVLAWDGEYRKGDGIEFSALPWTPHEIENAQHDFELPPVHYTVIRAALAQMGVGGDNSWGARTHPEYLIDVSHKLEFRFSFEGI